MTAETAARRIEYVPLDEIITATRNPKRHDIAGIQSSISRFGFVSPSIVDERTGRLIIGHGRAQALNAMRDAGQSPPAGVQVDDDGIWLVPMLTGWALSSDAEAEAFLVADNEWTVRGGWDNTTLAEVLDNLLSTDPELLAVTGFTEGDLVKLISSGDAPEDFPEYDDESIAVEHTCPKCGYAWSGGNTDQG